MSEKRFANYPGGIRDDLKLDGVFSFIYPPGNEHIPSQGTFESMISYSQGGTY